MNDYLVLLQWYYKFLLLGKFFENKSKTEKFSLDQNLQITTWPNSKFTLNSSQISSLLSEIHSHPNSKNVYGYLTEISAFRGIFSIMREMIEQLPNFRTQLHSIFDDQYFAFEQNIRFLRNVLSHSTTPSILVHLADFDKQKAFLLSQKVKKIRLNFIYSKYLPEREWSTDYACDIELDLFKIKPLTPLFSLITIHQLYLLSELCFNITKVITKRQKKR